MLSSFFYLIRDYITYFHSLDSFLSNNIFVIFYYLCLYSESIIQRKISSFLTELNTNSLIISITKKLQLILTNINISYREKKDFFAIFLKKIERKYLKYLCRASETLSYII